MSGPRSRSRTARRAAAARPRRSAGPSPWSSASRSAGRRLPHVDHVITVRLGRTDQLQARESLGDRTAPPAGPGAWRRTGRSARPSWRRSRRRTGRRGRSAHPARPRRCRPPSRPARRPSSGPPPGRGVLRSAQRPDRAAAADHQLQLVDVIRPRRQVVACARLGPLVAVDHHVDPARVQHLEQLVPLPLREDRRRRRARGPGSAISSTSNPVSPPRRSGIGIGIRAAPLHVAAVEQPARFADALQAVGVAPQPGPAWRPEPEGRGSGEADRPEPRWRRSRRG